ncbi:MAG: SecDF P1 head subdomain-containing protein, partial [Elioraea tepidiphila]
MMYFARWKIAAILGGIVLAAILAIPSFVPKERLGAAGEYVPWRQFHLGLDLKGGSYLLLEVDMDAVIRERLGNLADGARTRLRGANIGYTGLTTAERSVTLRLTDPTRAQEAVRLLRELANPISVGLAAAQPDLEVTSTADGTVTITLSETLLREKATQAVEQSIEIVRRRIDETGVVDPVIARQGANRLLVQLPGIQDPERIKQLIGTTARMTFHLLDDTADLSARTPPPGVMFLQGDRGPGGEPTRYAVRRRVEVDGANLTDARAGQDSRTGEWVVNFTFDSI